MMNELLTQMKAFQDSIDKPDLFLYNLFMLFIRINGIRVGL